MKQPSLFIALPSRASLRPIPSLPSTIILCISAAVCTYPLRITANHFSAPSSYGRGRKTLVHARGCEATSSWPYGAWVNMSHMYEARTLVPTINE
ncbi:hypothetical protein BU24DRAFT_424561 [Aaosphaeria arxii CBS 175.79]|uniref:Uncharacterized protein n=1 Tax=Aaosphaeria arxii CBS 175.79 TaxID=1450172 RepID=A0A6A5XKA9_9PLEO|nr:uncharacterized protein BU24DRAFT_424561 [Aaosphaeria arxii CBS 175.79]KAF2013562.1 hypothetical protein BU24DRAFT_424561 [Aaosphaeria arxii CBS 175.79]